MSSIPPSLPIKQDLAIKTFNAKTKCHGCAQYTTQNLIEYLEAGRIFKTCQECLTKEFMRTQEVKFKKVKFEEVKKK